MEFRFGIARSLVTAGVVVCAAVPLAGGVAYAAASPRPAAMHAARAHHRTTTLTTRSPNVHIRSKAKLTKRSRIVETLAMRGSRVGVKCYKTGPSISGDSTWYRVVSPRAGFVAGHELNVRREPAAGVASCKAKK
jgi:hypothetical protein